ncbi:MAG TPA: hypothetical protein VK963_02285 [Candidatus Saccharimonadales bacterium]|nr:hypothetical protein [Candidatus Saccharimonadales bacterium]
MNKADFYTKTKRRIVAELADRQLKTLKKLIETAETNLAGAKELLSGLVGDDASAPLAQADVSAGKVIEGAFDGQNMVGPDGKVYPVPANYASKSKLVQGDTLKLTIGDDGSFIYKQIGPAERRKLIGTLVLKDGQYHVEAGGTTYRVLFASVTYFKASPGDQVTIVVPEEGQAEWAAVEAVIG